MAADEHQHAHLVGRQLGSQGVQILAHACAEQMQQLVHGLEDIGGQGGSHGMEFVEYVDKVNGLQTIGGLNQHSRP
jgi:hypothetical protein